MPDFLLRRATARVRLDIPHYFHEALIVLLTPHQVGTKSGGVNIVFLALFSNCVVYNLPKPGLCFCFQSGSGFSLL